MVDRAKKYEHAYDALREADKSDIKTVAVRGEEFAGELSPEHASGLGLSKFDGNYYGRTSDMKSGVTRRLASLGKRINPRGDVRDSSYFSYYADTSPKIWTLDEGVKVLNEFGVKTKESVLKSLDKTLYQNLISLVNVLNKTDNLEAKNQIKNFIADNLAVLKGSLEIYEDNTFTFKFKPGTSLLFDLFGKMNTNYKIDTPKIERKRGNEPFMDNIIKQARKKIDNIAKSVVGKYEVVKGSAEPPVVRAVVSVALAVLIVLILVIVSWAVTSLGVGRPASILIMMSFGFILGWGISDIYMSLFK